MIDGLAIMVVCEKGVLRFLDLGFEGIFRAEDEVIVDDEALVGEFLLELFGSCEAVEFSEDVGLERVVWVFQQGEAGLPAEPWLDVGLEIVRCFGFEEFD